MSVVICTLCLNEMEWLPLLYEQHKNWPGLVKWVFVESADAMYAQANPDMVSTKGLSVDGTSDFLTDLAKQDDRVQYIAHGFSNNTDPAQGKCESRQRYLDAIEHLRPDMIVALDADEFWIHAHQQDLTDYSTRVLPRFGGLTFRYRNIWYPPPMAPLPLFSYEITGRLWQVLVCKVWRWMPGICYQGNHNSPKVNGKLLNHRLSRFDRKSDNPEFVHMGFASGLPHTRTAKNRYYVERGEGRTDHRQMYVDSRAAYEWWQCGDTLPNGDKLVPYDGPIPECFEEF